MYYLNIDFYNSNQKVHTLVIRSTIIFLKTLNSYMFQTLLAQNQGVINCCCEKQLRQIIFI